MKNIIFISVSSIAILLVDLPAKTQINHKQSFEDMLIETKGYYGFVISHHKKMEHLTQKHFGAFEISLCKSTFGNKLSEQLFNYPVLGVGYWHSDLGNNLYLGNANALFPYIDIPIRRHNHFSMNYRLASGLGMLSKRFDRFDNYKNIAIGSKLNIFIHLLYELKWEYPRFVFLTGIGLTHFSNGAFKIPNLGINIATINAGISYKLGGTTKEFIKKEIPPLNKTHEFHIIAAYGIKEMYPAYGDKYSTYNISTNYLKILNHKQKIGMGFDLFYSEANIRTLQRDTIDVSNKLSIVKPGINIAYELMYSKLSFIFQVGAYLYAKENSDGYVYNRLILRYPFTKHLFLNFSLKAHMAKAECVEWGIGYKF